MCLNNVASAAYVRACVCVRVRACVRVCVCERARARVCIRRVCAYVLNVYFTLSQTWTIFYILERYFECVGVLVDIMSVLSIAYICIVRTTFQNAFLLDKLRE